MKKSISLVAVFIISSAIALYGKKINRFISEKPATKSVQFLVFAGSDYSSPLYKKSKASVSLSICKINGDNREVLWEGNINNGLVKNYPFVAKPILRDVSIYNVYERKETIVAIYKVSYDSKGSTLSYERGIALSPGSTTDTLSIAI